MIDLAGKCRIVNTRNRMLSQNIQVTLNTRHTGLNNNILLIGGSGSGKTYKFVKPQIMQMSGSFIITDPKGEIYRDTSGFLKQSGFEIKVLNLLEMQKSSRFNPFRYIQSEADVLKLITNLIVNTTPKDSSTNDPFWEKAEAMLLQALFYYVWLEGVPEDISECKLLTGEDDRKKILDRIRDPNIKKVHNVRAVMELLKFADFKEDPKTGAKMDSTLDIIMRELEKKSPNHKAVLNYNKVMRGAADTVRSIIISANARLAPVQSEEILSILDEDEMDIPLLGIKKTAIYCVIPDNDTTYNFLIGILYNMMFQRLYYEADFVHGGSLPIHVTFLLDEFDNVALPENFLSLLSTMRSRNISSIIIIQDISQIRTRYKDGEHEKIISNCDTMIYLGGNGPSTQKELSELMGKATIDKRTNGETLGKQGNSSRNYDIVGRELMLPDELRKIEGNKCIVFIRGFDPILDQKIETKEHPLWNRMCAAAREELFDARIERVKKMAAKDRGRKIGFVDTVELEHLRLEDQHKRKHYEEEVRIAQITGQEVSSEPESHIFELTFAELEVLLETIEKEPENGIILDKDLIRNTREEINKIIKAEAEEQERMEQERIDVRGFRTPEEAMVYARLKNEKFCKRQMKSILRLVQDEQTEIGVEEIFCTFDNRMDQDTVDMLVELFIKEKK